MMSKKIQKTTVKVPSIIISQFSGAKIGPHSQWDLGDFFPNFERKKSQSSSQQHTHKLHGEVLLPFNGVFPLSRSAPRLESWSLSWTNRGARISSYQSMEILKDTMKSFKSIVSGAVYIPFGSNCSSNRGYP